MSLRLPRASRISRVLPITGEPVLIVCRRLHSRLQILALKISRHGWQIARSRGMAVILSAARLKEVIRQFESTVNTGARLAFRIEAPLHAHRRLKAITWVHDVQVERTRAIMYDHP